MRTDNERQRDREAAAIAASPADEPVREPGEAAPERDDRAEAEDHGNSLFEDADAEGYRTRWSGIQTGFVDEPRRAVEEADALVTEVIDRLTKTFSDERRRLETQWSRDDRVSTEDLRQAMRRYRAFFERMLALQDR